MATLRPAVQQDVFDQLEQFLRDLLIHFEHPGVDDSHVHPRFDRMKQKRGMHGLAHDVVATEGK